MGNKGIVWESLRGGKKIGKAEAPKGIFFSQKKKKNEEKNSPAFLLKKKGTRFRGEREGREKPA